MSQEPSPLRRWLSAALVAREPAPPPLDAPPSAADLQALRHRLDAAEAASAAKSRFLGHLGHEIRTPLAGVLGMAQLLGDTPLDATQRGYVELMQRSAGGLVALLDGLLDFAALEAGQVELLAQPVALRELLDDVAQATFAAARDKHLLFECQLAADLPIQVQGDAARLRQLVQHLVANAVKFTAVGQVLLRAWPEGEGVVVEVADTGVGLARALHERVFAPFVRGDDGLARQHDGVGLGLAVADTLARAMGGTIEVDSEPGRGAAFRARLPLPAGPPPTAPPVGAPQRVALVSDAPDALHALAARLQFLGHECVAQLSWRDLAFAPEALAERRPQAVIYDEPLAGWPPQAPLDGRSADAATPWQVLLLQRERDSAGAFAAVCRLLRPLSDASLAQALCAARGEGDAPAAAPARRGRVLLVEDHEINQIVARSFLEHLGFEVDVAADGAAAFAALRRHDHVLVVMDCQMPGMDGLELTRRLRAGEAGARAARTPIVALTAHATASDRERCLAAGMNDYLAKPVTVQQLAATVDRWLPARP